MSQLINLIRALQESGSSEDDRMSLRLQVQLAASIGCQLPVTVSGGGAQAVFNTQFYPPVNRLLSEINELYLIDTDRVLGIIKRVWVLRFNIVNSPQSTLTDINNLLAPEFEEEVGDVFTAGSYDRIRSTAVALLETLNLGD